MIVIRTVQLQRSPSPCKLFFLISRSSLDLLTVAAGARTVYVRPSKRPGSSKPTCTEVLQAYIRERDYPSWTSFFVRHNQVQNDHFGKSNFNFAVDNVNYHLLRTGCYPFIKFHCTKAPYEDLTYFNTFFGALKVLNLGIPMLAYGIAACFLIKHREVLCVKTANDRVVVLYFLIREEHDRGFRDD